MACFNFKQPFICFSETQLIIPNSQLTNSNLIVNCPSLRRCCYLSLKFSIDMGGGRGMGKNVELNVIQIINKISLNILKLSIWL